MSTTLQFRRYDTANIANTTGANGEIFIDTDKDTVVVQDGTTIGGFPLARESILNSAYSQANTARDTANGAYGQANVAYSQANDSYAQANAGYAQANAAYGVANTGYDQANAARSQANSAYAEANLKLNISGGTITGDLSVSGNLQVLGNSTTLNVETLSVEDNEIILNSNVTGSPSLDAFITINRGTSNSVALKWDETNDRWSWADDDGVYHTLSTSLLAYARANIANNQANFARDTANDAYSQANASYSQASTARDTANGAYAQANTARTTANDAYGVANTGIQTANGAYAEANAAHTQANAARIQANTARLVANAAYAQANDAYTAANNAKVTVYANSGAANATTQTINFVNTSTILVTVANTSGNANIELSLIGTPYDQANAAYGQANAAYGQANNAYNEANLKLNIAGGTITGNLVVSGNLEVLGNSTILNVETLLVEDNEIILNSSVSAPPTLNAYITINRGTLTNAELIWDETNDQWKWSDGEAASYPFDLMLDAYSQANAAYSQANAAYGQANTARGTANDSYGQANAAYAAANTRVLKAGDTMTGTLNVNSHISANVFRSTNTTLSAPSLSTFDGERLRLYDFNQAGHPNYAIGVEGSHIWMGVDDAGPTLGFKWYGNTTLVGLLRTNSTFEVSNTVAAKTIRANGTGTAIDASQGNILTNQVTGTQFNFLSGLYTASITGSGTVNSNYTLNLPPNTGLVGQMLTTDGTGNLNWSSLSLDTGNNAYAQANTARDTANAAYGQANTARGTANDAYAQANAAYGDANTRVLKAGDTMTGNLNVAATLITQNIIPNLNVTYSLGTPDRRFKDIYLSGNTIYLGDTVLSAAEDEMRANTFNAAVSFVSAGLNVLNQANSARGQANTARDQANTAYGQANNARDQANTARDTANGAYAQANGAYGQANGAYGQANGAYAQANTGIATANGAYAQANGAYAQANIAYGQANDAYTQANSARLQANTARDQANAGYGQANTARNTANDSYNQANTARDQANTARTTANDAYGAANTKLPLTGGTLSGDLTVAGNLTVTGSNTLINVANLSVNDSIILMANGQIGDVYDIGFVGHFDRGATNTHAGFIRKASLNEFYLFDNYEVEPTNNIIDINGQNFRLGNVRVNTINANSVLILGSAAATQANLTLAHDQANTARNQANTARDQANTARDQANTARDTANGAYSQANGAYAQANGAYAQANGAYGQANSAANTVAVYANDTVVLTRANVNFNNSGSINVSITSNLTTGRANIEFSANGTVLGIPAINTSLGTINTTIGTLNTTFGTINTNVTNVNSNAVNAYAQANSARGQANTARDQANTGYGQANSARDQANTARDTANGAYTQANGAYSQANGAYAQANGAYAQANTAANTVAVFANDTIVLAKANVNFNNSASINVSVTSNSTTGRANVEFSANGTVLGIPAINTSLGTINTTIGTLNTTFATVNTTFGTVNTNITNVNSNAVNAYAQANSARDQANTARDQANTAYGQANSARNQANTAYGQANDAYAAANTKLPSVGGTISGDLIISGNLVVSGNSTTLNTETLIVEDAEIILLSNVAGTPALNAGLIVNRGTSSNTFLRWNESSDKWGWSDDGAIFYSFDTSLIAYSQANSARDQANTARTTANDAYGAANTRVLKAGDTMTGNLIMSGATVNTVVANITTIITGNTLTLSTGAASNGNVVISANGVEYVRTTNTGNVGIGQTNPAYKLDISGDVRATGNVFALNFDSTSDLVMKENVREIENPLDTLKQLHGVMFTWKDSKNDSLGVIAQELEKVLPQLTSTNAEGKKSVTYNGIIALLIEAVKELAEKVEKNN